MTAKIIQLFPQGPPPQPSCFECVRGYYGENGVLCEVIREFVMDENDALDCEFYEERGSNGAA